MNANFMKNVPREALPNAQEMNSTDSVPWYLRYGARVLSTIGGILSIVLGAVCLLYATITLSASTVAAAIIEISAGVLVTLLEAPFLCSFLSFAQRPGDILEKYLSPFVKAMLYITLGILPIMIAFGTTTILGSGLVALGGVIFAVIGFGRKAPREQMSAAAMGQSPSSMEQGRPAVY